ncbi:MAG: hypothetical protein AMJ90_02650 [candidate division Zixibacteria bacterium SM23_73_2]|nr:MAG: hypothetical protein AMJ90_02650 [candidate division Zixibacteria bacterium SM23_73_2]
MTSEESKNKSRSKFQFRQKRLLCAVRVPCPNSSSARSGDLAVTDALSLLKAKRLSNPYLYQEIIQSKIPMKYDWTL